MKNLEVLVVALWLPSPQAVGSLGEQIKVAPDDVSRAEFMFNQRLYLSGQLPRMPRRRASRFDVE